MPPAGRSLPPAARPPSRSTKTDRSSRAARRVGNKLTWPDHAARGIMRGMSSARDPDPLLKRDMLHSGVVSLLACVFSFGLVYLFYLRRVWWVAR